VVEEVVLAERMALPDGWTRFCVASLYWLALYIIYLYYSKRVSRFPRFYLLCRFGPTATTRRIHNNRTMTESKPPNSSTSPSLLHNKPFLAC